MKERISANMTVMTSSAVAVTLPRPTGTRIATVPRGDRQDIDLAVTAFMLALPALLKGVLYNDDCIGAAWDLVKAWNYRERLEITNHAHQQGLDARAGKVATVERGMAHAG